MLREIVLNACYLYLIYQKLLRFFIDKTDQKKQFYKNDGYEVLLQPLITQKRMRFNIVLILR